MKRSFGKRWGIPMLLGLGWHIFWYAWLGLDSIPVSIGQAFMPDASRLIFDRPHTGTPDMTWRDRIVSSPTLFALPSEAGFSRPLLTNRIAVRPALKRQPVSGIILGKPELYGSGLPTTGMDALRRLIKKEDTLFMEGAVPRAVFTSIMNINVARLRIIYLNGFNEGDFVDVEIPEKQLGRMPWDIDVFLYADELRSIQHVVMEHPSEYEEDNLTVTRSLYRWRLADGVASRSGRIIVRYLGK